MSMKKTRFADELNDKQLEGVITTEGAVLVLAGAGSGKTRLLTYKIAHLVLELGIDPRSIMGVTFTNKASGEMKERAAQLCGDSLHGIWLGTFHSICGRILRYDSQYMGVDENYSIYDRSDQIRLMKDLINEVGLDPKQYDARGILSAISRMKNDMLDAERFYSNANNPKHRTIGKLWILYQEALKANNAVDFDDMILKVVEGFNDHEDLRDRYAKKFEYLLVDEFQDTNLAQYELIKHICSHHKNITVVGDDDQSIYGWRGAQVQNILEFPDDFEKTRVIRLEQNYRSTGKILQAASSVVANNESRHPKKLWTESDEGENISLWEVPDEYAEARIIAESIKKDIDGGKSANEIAVLYRVNAHSRLLEEALRKKDIPHIIIGGIRFYERAEIKDALAYLRLINNPLDDVAFSRIINMPRRGVGMKSMLALRELASIERESLYNYLAQGDLSVLPNYSMKGFGKFVDLIEELRVFAKDADIGQLIGEVLRKSGYMKMLMEDGSIEARARLDNLSELVNSGIEFANTHPDEPTLNSYLAQASLLTDIDQYDNEAEKVSLMTVHSAKGLEFDIVYLCGLEEGLFPISRSMESSEELEEERRLFYVATTRAREKVHLLWAYVRRRFGKESTSVRSRFIDEVPVELLSHSGGSRSRRVEPKRKIISARPKKSKRNVQKSASGAIAPGTVVEHPFFGRGKVKRVKGWGENSVLTVAFPKYGQKKLLLKYADISIISS